MTWKHLCRLSCMFLVVQEVQFSPHWLLLSLLASSWRLLVSDQQDVKNRESRFNVSHTPLFNGFTPGMLCKIFLMEVRNIARARIVFSATDIKWLTARNLIGSALKTAHCYRPIISIIDHIYMHYLFRKIYLLWSHFYMCCTVWDCIEETQHSNKK